MNNDPISLLFNLTSSTKDILKNAIERGVVLAPEEVFEKRATLCKECPELDSTLLRCKVCGCFMNAKARFDASKCPAGKW